MKKTYLGIGLLAVLLLLSCLCSVYLARQSASVCRLLEQAQQQSLSDSLADAQETLQAAEQSWQHRKNSMASLIDHAPMEQIDDLFRGAEEYAAMGQKEEFSLMCGRICRLLQAASQAQQLYWWNLL